MTILSGGVLIPAQAGNVARDPSILSDSSPQIIQNRYYGNDQGLIFGDAFQTYAEIYRRQPQIATLITKVGFTAARTPVRVYQKDPVDGRVDVTESSPFGRLMANPNPKHSRFFFWLWTVSTFELYGESMWIKVRPGRGEAPTQLWPMHPANVLTQRADDGVLWYLIYLGNPGNGGDPILAYPETDVVHFRMYNPDNQIRGLSRLESLRSTLAGDSAMQQMQASFWANGARPSVLLTAPGKLSQRALNRLKADWENLHAGVQSWGKTAVLEEGVTATLQPLNAAELQYIESRKLSWSEACSLYDVPPPAVHILDHATYSNITEQERMLYRDSMGPRFELYKSDVDSQLRLDFSPRPDIFMDFYTDEMLRGDVEARTEMYQKAIQSGWMMPAEARERENMPDGGPETHQLYANAATIPLGYVKLRPAGTDPAPNPVPEPDATVAPKKLPYVPTVKVARLCTACETAQDNLSRRGWCRSCEGKAGRRKELTA